MNTQAKTVIGTYSAPRPHWEGDGYPVRSLFNYRQLAKHVSPFLLLDYAGPAHFEPTDKPRGIGMHGHRGMETVTLIYRGEVAHRDSTGESGTIGPGDVQWMTAGSGILHEEFHSPAFTAEGGALDMVQLWVNLPARHKWTQPKYPSLTRAQIPVVKLPGGAGQVRVIAGALGDTQGPAETFTPMNLWDLQLKAGHTAVLTVPEGHNTAVVVLHGTVQVNGGDLLHDAQLALLGARGDSLTLTARSDAIVLLLSGEPIDEPLFGRGPYVMNTPEDLEQAWDDYHAGRLVQA